MPDPTHDTERAAALSAPADYALDPGTDIGHVHLKVADLDRAIAFYRDVLGFDLMARLGGQAAFLSAGGYHHHIGLNTWETRGGTPPPRGTTGLYHVAIRYPTGRRWRARCAGSSRPTIPSTAPRTTASARRSTCTTPTATASRSTATARARSGPRGWTGRSR